MKFFKLLFNVKSYFLYFRIILGKLIYINYLKYKGVEIGRRVTLLGLAIVSKHNNSRILIGDNCQLISNSIDTALGCNHKLVLRTLSSNSSIIIGNNTGISCGSICAAGSIVIGSDCLIGANVTIIDNDFHPISPQLRLKNRDLINNIADIDIGNNVFIGTNVLILKGVTIGNNSVIAAGSVVVKPIPSDVVAAGSPCIPVKHLSTK